MLERAAIPPRAVLEPLSAVRSPSLPAFVAVKAQGWSAAVARGEVDHRPGRIGIAYRLGWGRERAWLSFHCDSVGGL